MSGPLRALAAAVAGEAATAFHLETRDLAARDALARSWFDAERLRGRTVLIVTRSQVSAALALLALDGIAARMILCPPGLSPAHLARAAEVAQAEAIAFDELGCPSSLSHLVAVPMARSPRPHAESGEATRETEWVLMTSGTTGAPKLIVHTLATLARAIAPGGREAPAVWGTFYDIRRYGGLQILLRALLAGQPLVLAGAGESQEGFLRRAAAAQISFLSGTPSHWRRALMAAACAAIHPRIVRLSGEIADQTILDRLGERFPEARIVHAFASTEAGVVFEVTDGREGFPAAFLEGGAGVQPHATIKLEGGTLCVRSAGVCLRVLGHNRPLTDESGFIDTGDTVELRDGRCTISGRRDGTINVGGNKVHPEEIEALLNRHPFVQMARVRARKSPVLGAVVQAEIVLREPANDDKSAREQIQEFCAGALPPHKRPAIIRLVPSLALGAAGKLERSDA